MMKFTLPLAILVLIISSCGSDESESKDLDEAKVTAEKEAKPSRKRSRRSRRDSLYSEITPVESIAKTSAKPISKKDGINLSYYPSGKVKSEVFYKNGKKNGSGKWYFESGQLKYEGNWKNGKQDGVEMAYFASGQLRQEAYLRDGRAQGIYKEYSQTGELLVHMKYENGELIDLK